MHQVCKATAVAAAIAISSTEAFVANPMTTVRTNLPTTRAATNLATISQSNKSRHQTTRLYNAEEDDAQDSEIERLKKMAAKLRAEAASLEAEKAKQLAEAAEKAFNRFDINSDGEVSLSELKLGLEKELKVRFVQWKYEEFEPVSFHM